MKQMLANGGVRRQGLLIPEVVELDPPKPKRWPRAPTNWRSSA